jgi:hypothetical protein
MTKKRISSAFRPWEKPLKPQHNSAQQMPYRWQKIKNNISKWTRKAKTNEIPLILTFETAQSTPHLSTCSEENE